MRRAQHGKRTGEGQSLVEFALVLPLILMLIVNVVNFAGFFYGFVTVANASRSAGDYTIMGKVAYSGTDDRSATCAPAGGCASTDSAAGSSIAEPKCIGGARCDTGNRYTWEGNPILEGVPASGAYGVGVRLIHLNEQDRQDSQRFSAAARPRRQA